MILILFGAILSTLIGATSNMDDCKKLNFEPKACKVEKVLNNLGE